MIKNYVRAARKAFPILFFATSTCNMTAQVGVNTQTPKASLDVSATTSLASDGILIPRMSVQDLMSRHTAGLYSTNQNSILVYVNDITGASSNTETEKITQIGFYYYNSAESKWIPITPLNTGIWDKVGTTVASELNTDDSYLMAKAVIGGNQIGNVNGGTGNAQLTILGEDISVRDVTIGAGGGGSGTNSVIGKGALVTNTKGTYNVAIGAGALGAMTESYGNIAVGAGAAANVTANSVSSFGFMSSAGANYSTAIGANSTIDATSQSAAALGYYSTIEKASSGSVALGEGAKVSENSLKSLAMGYHSNTSDSIAIAIGSVAVASAENATAIGSGAVASAKNAIAIGSGATNNINDAAFYRSKTTYIGNTIGESNVTLEISGERSEASKADGILIPRVTIGELNAKDGQYAEPQFGALVFVNYIGDGTATGKTVDITSYGVYYYDYWNGKGARWTKLIDASILLRQSSVEVGADKTYTTLQEAYNSEAKKLYNQYGVPVEFVCSGEVGGLDTDGSIPFIKIKSDGTMTSSDKGLTFNSTMVRLDGKIAVKNYSITAYNSDIVVLVNAEIEASQLSIDNSTFKAFFGGNTLTFNNLTCFNGFIDIEGSTTDTDLILNGSTNVGYLVSSTNRSYILFANGVNITCNSTSTQNTAFMVSKASTIYCNSVKKISFNGSYSTSQPSYDIYASTIGNIIFDECKDIGGSSKPSFVMAASHRSNIIAYQTTMSKNTAKDGISVVSGSTFYLIGDRTSITINGAGSSSSIGLNSSGSTASLSNITASNPMLILQNFDIGLEATDGGTINAMGRIQRTTGITQANIPVTIGTPSLTGAVIYDSATE